MSKSATDFDQVTSILNHYFEGLYEGNTELLESICDQDLILSTPSKRRPLKQWLQDVDSRDVPKTIGDPFVFKILSLDLVGDQAMAKLDCPLLGHNYIDFIGLLKEGSRWKIVSKMYSE